MAIQPEWELGDVVGAVKGVRVICDSCGSEIRDPDDGAVIIPTDLDSEGAGGVQVGFYHLTECLAIHLLLAWADPDRVVIVRLREHAAGMRSIGVCEAYARTSAAEPTHDHSAGSANGTTGRPPAADGTDDIEAQFQKAMEEAGQKKRRKPRGDN